MCVYRKLYMIYICIYINRYIYINIMYAPQIWCQPLGILTWFTQLLKSPSTACCLVLCVALRCLALRCFALLCFALALPRFAFALRCFAFASRCFALLCLLRFAWPSLVAAPGGPWRPLSAVGGLWQAPRRLQLPLHRQSWFGLSLRFCNGRFGDLPFSYGLSIFSLFSPESSPRPESIYFHLTWLHRKPLEKRNGTQ